MVLNMEEKIINNIEVKVADKYPIKEQFDLGEGLTIALKGSIVKKDIKDNQDGTVDIVLHFKAIDYIINKDGQTKIDSNK